jgi:hypothetical protein
LGQTVDLAVLGLGTQAVHWMVSNVVVAHAPAHRGEMACLKGLQGMHGYLREQPLQIPCSRRFSRRLCALSLACPARDELGLLLPSSSPVRQVRRCQHGSLLVVTVARRLLARFAQRALLRLDLAAVP